MPHRPAKPPPGYRTKKAGKRRRRLAGGGYIVETERVLELRRRGERVWTR